MTDDFQLFQDQADGDPVDADIALITAYLARELSLVQTVAVQDRLGTDRAFREKVAPIIDAWAMPTPLGAAAGRGAADAPALARDEIETGWQRYVGERAELDAHDGPRLIVGVEKPKRRRISMTRIAAGIAAITLPIIALAQAVVYASKHPAVPGHTVAKVMVAPFVEAPPAAPPRKPEKPLPSPEDVRVSRELEKGAPAVQRAAKAEIPVTETAKPVTPPPVITPAPVWVANPDRAKIAALVSKHMPEVIRGDTSAAYIVMVMDASDNYIWGTYGNGSIQVQVAGDKRTAGDRSALQLQNSIEYTGVAPGARGTLARVGGAGGSGGRARGGSDSGQVVQSDTAILKLRDSLQRIVTSVRIRDSVAAPAGQMVARAGAGGAGGNGGAVARGVGGGAFATVYSREYVGSYTVGMVRYGNGQAVDLNSANGLQELGNGESGIQGLKAESLTMGEQYFFSPGQLARQPLRVIVVHLAPGTNWKGR